MPNAEWRKWRMGNAENAEWGTAKMRNGVTSRDLLRSSAAVIAAARLSRHETLASQIAASKRVGLIGGGWYGKSDLLRLVQVAPVNVVSLCDVDSRMLGEAADLVATRQASKKRPRPDGGWREKAARQECGDRVIG